MAEEQKAKIILEIDRAEFDTYLVLLNHKKSNETEKIWEEMVKGPVIADTSKLEDDELVFKAMVISVAILSVENKVK